LRLLLEGYTGIPGKDISFCYGPNGKPGIAPQEGCPDIRFNVSHTRGLTQFAFTLGQDIGVDVESTAQPTNFHEDLSRILGASELSILHSLPPEQRNPLCIKYWTRKEACLKCLGIGLSCGPESVDVSNPPIVSIKAVPSSEHQPGDKALWLTDIELGERYFGACALGEPTPPKIVRYFRCDLAVQTFGGGESPLIVSEELGRGSEHRY
jgi:4'-phosphopantetheinyl transferase